MSNPNSPDLADLAARVTELEILITHLQQSVDDLHGVALRQAGDIARFVERLTSLQSQYSSLAAPPSERDPLAERPPHY